MSEKQNQSDHQQAIKNWEEKILRESEGRFPERRKEFITTSSEIDQSSLYSS